MSTLHNVVVLAEKEEVARGIRILLRTPLVTDQSDPGSFDLLRRRAGPVRMWFVYTCGWTLIVEPRLGYLRLVKVGVGGGQDASRPARRMRTGRAAFDRRRYTLLCVVAAEVVFTPMTTIGILADRVTQACATDDGLPNFDSALRSERSAFADVLRLLESLAVLTSLNGDTDSFVETATAKVLYKVDGALLVRMLAATTGPSQLAVPPAEIAGHFDELIESVLVEPRYGDPDRDSDDGSPGATDTQRNLWLRHSVLRKLFDDPVVYRSDLSQPQLDYLASLTGRRILRSAVEQAGFELEERAEGWLLVDRDGLSTDSRFPDSASTAKTAALVLLDQLSDSAVGASRAELDAAAEAILARAPGWARTYRSEGAPSVWQPTRPRC